jgi:hypothetical protein
MPPYHSGHPTGMAMDKQTIVDFIRDRGDDERVAEAEELLPDRVELPRDEALLARLGVEADDLDDSGVW